MDEDLHRIACLTRESIGRLDPDTAITMLQASERLVARLHAIQADLLVAAASGHPLTEEILALDPRPDRHEERRIRITDAVREEVAAALRWSPATAQSRIDEARLLSTPLSGTRSALHDGQISPRHARQIVEAAGRLAGRWSTQPDEQNGFLAACASLEQRVLPTARRSTAAGTRACARRAVISLDAPGVARRRREARCTREVYLADEVDDVATIVARLGSEQAHALLAAVRACAAAASQDDPALTAGERRAEALVALVLGSDPAGAGAAGGVRVTARLDVVVPLEALATQASSATDAASADAPSAVQVAVFPWSMPVSRAAVLDLLSDERIDVTARRLVVDPTGKLLDVGRAYRVPDRLRQHIIARDRTCRFPGCRRAAAQSQIDHAVAWDDGGGTSLSNLGALCTRHHHQLKTHAGWQITASDWSGSCTWLSPMGRTYQHDPPGF